MPLNSLRKVLVDELKDLYSAENQIIKALPKMAKAVESPLLKEAFESHLAETRAQVDRLERAASLMGESSLKGKKCAAMEGLLKEGKEILEEGGDATVMDAALIGAAQKVEHYEIASYGTARTHARHLGLEQVAQLLQQTLDEEGQADKNLTKIAQRRVNLDAKAEGGNVKGSKPGAKGSAKSSTSKASKNGRAASGTSRSTSKTAAKTGAKSAARGSSKSSAKSGSGRGGSSSGASRGDRAGAGSVVARRGTAVKSASGRSASTARDAKPTAGSRSTTTKTGKTGSRTATSKTAAGSRATGTKTTASGSRSTGKTAPSASSRSTGAKSSTAGSNAKSPAKATKPIASTGGKSRATGAASRTSPASDVGVGKLGGGGGGGDASRQDMERIGISREDAARISDEAANLTTPIGNDTDREGRNRDTSNARYNDGDANTVSGNDDIARDSSSDEIAFSDREATEDQG